MKMLRFGFSSLPIEALICHPKRDGKLPQLLDKDFGNSLQFLVTFDQTNGRQLQLCCSYFCMQNATSLSSRYSPVFHENST